MSLSPSLASLEIPAAEAALGWKFQVLAAAPLCSMVQTSVQWQLLSWKAFQGKLQGLNNDKCWGHKRCCSQILFPTFLALSYGLNLNTQAVRRPKLSSSSLSASRDEHSTNGLSEQSYQSQSTTAAQNSSASCHFALDQGDTHKKVP